MRIAALFFFCLTQAFAQDSPWKKLEFLLGNWTGVANEKETPRGAGQGGFTFEPQLEGKIVVRRNAAEYTSGPRHDDLMVIYLEGSPRAIYFDSEGHVIRYNLTFPEPGRAVFESDGTQPGPRYRLTYWLEKSELRGKFEIAPPGAAYAPYMSWGARKR